MLQACPMCTDLVNEKKLFFASLSVARNKHMSHIFRHLEHCVLWSNGVPPFIRQRQRNEIKHNSLNDKYSTYNASERIVNS